MFQSQISKSKLFRKKKPLVSICTITFNRYNFLNILKGHIINQTYPTNLIEWIIIDDSTDKIDQNIIKDSRLNIKYSKLKERTKIGKKRNIANNKAKGDIIIIMDDDDFYPVNRVSYVVDKLTNSEKLISGSTCIPILYLPEKELWMAGPYGNNHATAATFAFNRKLLNITQFNDDSKSGEEKEFLKGYTIPMLQLDPFSTIICIAHKSNTFEKRQMRLNPKKYNFKKLTIDKSDFDKINQISKYYKDLI